MVMGNKRRQYEVNFSRVNNKQSKPSMNRPLFFIFYFLLFTLNAFPQAPQLGVTIEDEFKATTVPDKWKNESAVIIGQKTEYLFTRIASGKNYSTVVRINEFI